MKVLIILLLMSSYSYASISDSDAIKAIIGEAEGENIFGKEAVACAIRNRRNLVGVYGKNSRRVRLKLYSKKIERESIGAWIHSENPENCKFIEGATGWGDSSDLIKFRKEKWFKKCKIVAHVDNHWFFKEKL